VSTETIRRNLVAADWTKKKLELRARQRSDELRLDWLRRVAIFSAEMYVFCDESGVDRRDGARRTGWAPRGVPPWAYAALARGHRFHLLPAISVNGLIDVLLYQGHTTSEGFFIWLRDCLLPKMNPFPGPNSILVMDNASWHKNPAVGALCRDHGVLLWYLPPYSPDFNPIEAFFGDLKAFIRRHYTWKGGDSISEDDFKLFLETSAKSVGTWIDAIAGHYKKAGMTFQNQGALCVNYAELYAAELRQYIENGTVC